MKLIWHASDLQETCWIREIFAGLVQEEITDLRLTCFESDSIHVVGSNWPTLVACEDYFRECRARCRHIVLLHLSDEWFSGGYRAYRHFDAVIRNYRTRLTEGSGILTIPIGYPNDTRVGSPILPADSRRYAWSFIGQMKASRREMWKAFDSFEPHLATSTDGPDNRPGSKVTKADFDLILEDSVFSPCPMGNVLLETWRLYESLELGCIPLVERRLGLDYFEELFGPNPIPMFHTWTAARRYAEALLGDKQKLLCTQAALREWWAAHKETVRTQVREIVNGPSRAPELCRYGDLLRNRVPLVHEGLRLAELLRHQSGASLRRRMTRPKRPLQRIINESVRRAHR